MQKMKDGIGFEIHYFRMFWGNLNPPIFLSGSKIRVGICKQAPETLHPREPRGS